MRRLAVPLASVSLLLVAACGGDDDDGGDDGNAGGQADAAPGGSTADAAPVGDGFTVTWGPVTVQPGEEDTRCVTRRLGNPEALQAHQIHNLLGDASHHLIVYRVSDTEERPEPYGCTPFSDTLDPSKGAPLMISQKAEDLLTLPEGVAFELAANQMIRLELHYINTGEQPKDVTASSTFIPIAGGTFEAAADLLFAGNPDISVPANSQLEPLGPVFMPVPADLADAKFFAITGHQHQWGVGVEVATAASATAAEQGNLTTVYAPEPFLWDEPETVVHSPPFQVPDGGGFYFKCEWINTGTQTAEFGESANDEMCFFWAYYYPSQGARVCFHSDQFGGGIDACCPGHAACGFLGF